MSIVDQLAPEPERLARTNQTAPLHQRLIGWVIAASHRSRRGPWVEVRVADFAAAAGCNVRSVWKALAKVRRHACVRWRLVFRYDRGPRGAWCLLGAAVSKLAYDHEPLYLTSKGRRRHLRCGLRCPDLVPTGKSVYTVRRSNASTVRDCPSTIGRVFDQQVNAPPAGQKRVRARRISALAWHLTRCAERLHQSKPWRVGFHAPSMKSVVEKLLLKGHHCDAVMRSHQRAMDRVHAACTDLAGTTKPANFVGNPSGVYAKMRQSLSLSRPGWANSVAIRTTENTY